MWFYAILRLKSNYKPREGKRHQMHRLQPSYIQKVMKNAEFPQLSEQLRFFVQLNV